MSRVPRQPKYRLHKARKCAVVTLNGKNHYLGAYESPGSYEQYARLIAEWQRNHGSLPQASAIPGLKARPMTVSELILAYFRYAEGYYVKHGQQTSEVGCIRQALRAARRIHGSTPAGLFGPKALKDVRQSLVESGRCRNSINKDIHRIKRMYRWAVEEEILSASTYHQLQCVRGLAKGKSAARETPGVRPVLRKHVDAILPLLPPPVAAMVQLQLLTGARPQEVSCLRPSDVKDAGSGVWHYVPLSHKTEHHNRNRVIVLGPRAQEVLRPWLDRDAEQYCFRPAEAVAWMIAKRRVRQAKVDNCGVRQPVNETYDRHSYRKAVQRACLRAKVPAWSPNQLRHTAATEIRNKYKSLDAAKAVLGHTDTRVTEIYAERDLGLAETVMRDIG